MKEKELRLIEKLLEKAEELGWNYDYDSNEVCSKASIFLTKFETTSKTVTFETKIVTDAEDFLNKVRLSVYYIQNPGDVEVLVWMQQQLENLYYGLESYYDELINSEEFNDKNVVVNVGITGISHEAYKKIEDKMFLILSQKHNSNFDYEKREVHLHYISDSSKMDCVFELDALLYPCFLKISENDMFEMGCYPIRFEHLTNSFDEETDWKSFYEDFKEIVLSLKSMDDEDVDNRIEKEGLGYALLHWRIDYYQCKSIDTGKAIYETIIPLERLDTLLQQKSNRRYQKTLVSAL